MLKPSSLSFPKYPHVLTRRAVSSLSVGLRREDTARLWERRAPLTPAAVYRLVRSGVQVVVQGCNRRVFSDKEYVSVSSIPTATNMAGKSIFRIRLGPRLALRSNLARLFWE
jgi:alpha-aminoadipic semialdehyde synthase